MPKLNIEDFDDTPHVGDKVKVMGKVNHINEDSGEVDVSYDNVSIVKKHKNRNHDSNNDVVDETVTTNEQVMPQSQTLDEALARSFPNTQ